MYSIFSFAKVHFFCLPKPIPSHPKPAVCAPTPSTACNNPSGCLSQTGRLRLVNRPFSARKPAVFERNWPSKTYRTVLCHAKRGCPHYETVFLHFHNTLQISGKYCSTSCCLRSFPISHLPGFQAFPHVFPAPSPRYFFAKHWLLLRFLFTFQLVRPA